jgi:esterase/lipase superfamily enzyme
MEMLVFGHGGLPAIVFPTSRGRFYEFEEFGMVEAIRWKLESGQVQLFCVDSVDAESWYNRDVPPRWRIARQMQYEDYVMSEVLPLTQQMNWSPKRILMGCSFGAYHAADMAFRHPDVFTGMLSMGGAFDTTNFLQGYHDQDVYFHQPMQYLRHMSDPWFFDRYRQNSYVLATGEWDICRGANERMAELLHWKGIPCKLDVWGEHSMHDWPEWKKMIQTYL